MEGKHKIGLDIVKLARIIIDDKKKMGIYCGVAAVIAIIVAFSIPRIYKSSIMLAPGQCMILNRAPIITTAAPQP